GVAAVDGALAGLARRRAAGDRADAAARAAVVGVRREVEGLVDLIVAVVVLAVALLGSTAAVHPWLARVGRDDRAVGAGELASVSLELLGADAGRAAPAGRARLFDAAVDAYAVAREVDPQEQRAAALKVDLHPALHDRG